MVIEVIVGATTEPRLRNRLKPPPHDLELTGLTKAPEKHHKETEGDCQCVARRDDGTGVHVLGQTLREREAGLRAKFVGGREYNVWDGRGHGWKRGWREEGGGREGGTGKAQDDNDGPLQNLITRTHARTHTHAHTHAHTPTRPKTTIMAHFKI